MTTDSSRRKVLSRRSLFAAAGGAAGLLIAKKVAGAATLSHAPGTAPLTPEAIAQGLTGASGQLAGGAASTELGTQVVAGSAATAVALNGATEPARDPSIPLPEEDKRLTGERDPQFPPPEADKRITGERADPSIPPPEADRRLTGEGDPTVLPPWADKRITGEGDPNIPGPDLDKRLTGEGDPNVLPPDADLRLAGEEDKRLTGEGDPNVVPPDLDKRLTGEGDPSVPGPLADVRLPGEPFEAILADAVLPPPDADKRRTGEGEPGVPPPETDKRFTAEGEPGVPPAWADKRMTGEGEADVPPREADIRKPGEAKVPGIDEDKRRLGSPDESPAAEQPAPRYLTDATDPVLQLVSPARPGMRVHGYSVISVHDVYMGAVPVILADATGARFQVDVLKKDTSWGAPKSVADTPHLSLFLSNDGNGRTASEESRGLGAIALAALLSAPRPDVPRWLLTWRERISRFPDGEYKAPA